MATLPIKPLDGADGYLRWKESVLLRLHSVGVAHVLSDERPAPGLAEGGSAKACGSASAAAKKWARDDAVCRGHILYALSDRILPDYDRHGTGRAVWRAVARTYDLDTPRDEYSRQYETFLHRFRFDEEEEEEGGASLLEQLAHAEALVATRDPPPTDYEMAFRICQRFPKEIATPVRCGEICMERIWRCALRMEDGRHMTEVKKKRPERRNGL